MVVEERGASTVFWAVFFAFIMIPLLALSIELSRYARAAGEVQAAADAAALAAVREVSIPHFRRTGQVLLHAGVYNMAQYYALLNTYYLPSRGIYVRITDIQVDQATRTVLVRCRADVSRLFPAFVPQIVIEREGRAEVRLRY
jgi:hypothetical protein